VSKAEKVAKGLSIGWFINRQAGAYANLVTAQCRASMPGGIGTILAMLKSRHDEAFCSLPCCHFSIRT
jgi:hypothetical protein